MAISPLEEAGQKGLKNEKQINKRGDDKITEEGVYQNVLLVHWVRGPVGSSSIKKVLIRWHRSKPSLGYTENIFQRVERASLCGSFL